MAHKKHDQVRCAAHARCAYCGVGEEDAGGELTVDHYTPTSAGGDDSDANLVYSCFHCNLFKGDFHPTKEDRAKGHFVLHPFRDDVSKHVHLDETTGQLEPLSETGRFHIALLHLNRPALIAFRLRRRYYELLLERRGLIDAENSELRIIIKAQEKYIAHLKRLLEGA